ncbi:sigma-E factor regulatory protein RseB domain-containing protein [Nonomuraea sp. NPDC050691]|uniref:LolA family protein n=1 Tax=Nonomuraea sp. NPDC050691 TaxID=3155661 RepID=UPI0033CDB75A
MRRGTFVRWGVPIAAAAVIGGALGAGPVIAAVSGEPALPERTAQQLLADAAAASRGKDGPPAMSGTVQQTASLGLPALPQAGGESPLTLLSGSHEIKVWYGAKDKLRVAMPTQMNETDLIVNGGQTWYWDSAANTATRIKVEAGVKAGEDGRSAPRPHDLAASTLAAMTPQAMAEQVLARAGEYSVISVANTDKVAGRPVYQLVVAPKDAASLVKEVRLSLDGETYVPLQVQVFAKGSAEPAFQLGFTQVTFSPPAEENFTFTPPAGAKVKETTLGAGEHAAEQEKAAEARKAAADRLKVVGDGWTSVAVLKLSEDDLKALQPGGKPAQDAQDSGAPQDAKGAQDGDVAAIADGLLKAATPVSGTWGSGKLITTKLVTVLITDDGRLLAGAVTPEEITKAAGVK